MKKYNTVILYHAYGQEELYQQVFFSILTLYYHLKGDFSEIKVVVYTDKPRLFEKYAAAMPLAVEHLRPEVIQAYKGKYNFVHRVKICVLQDCFARYQANILYLDSDTYFTMSPVRLLSEINPETSIMNSDDYDLVAADEMFENTDWLHIRWAIREKKYVVDKQEIAIPLTTRMWNAGVIGLSLQQARLLDKVLDLTDQIYAHRHVFTAEQFAFSYYLQNRTRLISSGDVIFHYWPNHETRFWKQTYNYHFQSFYRHTNSLPVEAQAELAYKLTLQHHQLKLPEKSLLQKLLKRLKLVAEVAVNGKVS